MKDYGRAFLQTCLAGNILRFGEFTLKSGRVSPYFFNAGLFNDGELLGRLAAAYAGLIAEKLSPPFMLYGPAYKGIPLAAATAMRLADAHGLNVPFAFNRKEAKDHGEGGTLVGAELAGDVVIIDDVITAGTAINESVRVITKAGARVGAVVIALDRQEVAGGESRSAVQQVEDRLQAPVYSILKLDDLVEYLESDATLREFHPGIVAYREKYGCKN